ncbi:potassium-tellurite ethidium and proflavin transporter [Rhodococcus sp. IEGM 1366]|uniref:SLAC1 family transporter n=1 Tax=Rhodococcus sp. IEGM 1366 TaxID=3082223 RepID=UPI00295321B9|nr:potassium-tellurite ethidium and proflavin transporter [Rhodococcus sp. IEGM 1366]MDV8070690.1 potassium-tellurite ethidium and proflavin transporter [Rhodococcus sp. IEGM 1366]
MSAHTQSVALGSRTRTRLPLNTLAIPLGFAGLAQAWSVATTALGTPFALAQTFWLIAALAWISTATAHIHRSKGATHGISHQLTHFAQGPLAALLPISAMLLGTNLHRTFPLAGTLLTLFSIAAAAAFGAWMMSFWMRGEMALESVHGGYYLPISAAGLVGALAAAQSGLDWLAVGCFAVGLFFWVVITMFLFLRLALRPTMPAALVPTLAIMIAPPAVGAAAWLTISNGQPDVLFEALTSITAFMVMVQVPLLARYRALPFSHGFWSFTFPVTSVVALAIVWLHLLHPPAWQVITVGLLGAATILVALIAMKSILLIRTTLRRPAQ